MNHITLRLSESDFNIVMAGLGKLPAELSHNLINVIMAELERQKAADKEAQTGAAIGLEGNHAVGHQQQSLNSGSAHLASPQ